MFWKPSCLWHGKTLKNTGGKDMDPWWCHWSCLVSLSWNNTLLYLPVMWGNTFFTKLWLMLAWVGLLFTRNWKLWLVSLLNIFCSKWKMQHRQDFLLVHSVVVKFCLYTQVDILGFSKLYLYLLQFLYSWFLFKTAQHVSEYRVQIGYCAQVEVMMPHLT